MITFEDSNNQLTSHAPYVKVLVGYRKKHTGNIVGNTQAGYYYSPFIGNKSKIYWTLQDCKDSLTNRSNI